MLNVSPLNQKASCFLVETDKTQAFNLSESHQANSANCSANSFAGSQGSAKANGRFWGTLIHAHILAECRIKIHIHTHTGRQVGIKLSKLGSSCCKGKSSNK